LISLLDSRHRDQRLERGRRTSAFAPPLLRVGEATAGQGPQGIEVAATSAFRGRLSLSRADFVTSGGVRLEKRGVTPDLSAPLTLEDRRAGRDPGLEAAVAALAGTQADAAMAVRAAPKL